MTRIKDSLRQLLPPRAYLVAKRMYNAASPSRRNQWNHVQRILEKLPARGRRVLGGPFEGMAYLPSAFGSQLLPKVIGSYEQEVGEALAELLARRPDVVVDIGCAEGYYACGFARELPDATVLAYDSDRTARYLCERLAAANDVGGRLSVRSLCTAATLQTDLVAARSGLVISDCEGAELGLLDPQKAPALRRAAILVELHEHMRSGLTDELVQRFAETHEIALRRVGPRDAATVRAAHGLEQVEANIALDEQRSDPNQQWAVMTPRTRAPS